MRKSAWFTKISLWLYRFVHVQLFITLISLPILAWWGLPISLLTIIGNMIFAPFLSAFLFLASLLFFLELLHLPNGILAWLLEQLTWIWFWCMHFAGRSWLFALPKPPIWLCILVPASAVIVVLYTLRRSWQVKISGLLFIMVFACSYLKCLQAPKKLCSTIACAQGSVTLVHAHNTTVLIDTGALNRIPTPESWVEYTLLPELIKQLGSTKIDHYVFVQPTFRGFKAAQAVVEFAPVKNVYFPYWCGDADKKLLGAYGGLKRACADHNVTIKRMGKTPLTINLSNDEKISLTTQKPWITKGDISFPQIAIQTDTEPISQ